MSLSHQRAPEPWGAHVTCLPPGSPGAGVAGWLQRHLCAIFVAFRQFPPDSLLQLKQVTMIPEDRNQQFPGLPWWRSG